MNSWLRRLRGALGTALMWGVGWFVSVGVVAATLSMMGVLSLSWSDVIFASVRSGIVGGVAGGAFAGVISLLYRGRRLSEINWVLFGIGGAVVTGLFVPVFLQAMNLLSGDGLVPWELVLDDALWTSVFGGTVAGGSLKLAQSADTMLAGDGPDQIERSDSPERLAGGEEREGGPT